MTKFRTLPAANSFENKRKYSAKKRTLEVFSNIDSNNPRFDSYTDRLQHLNGCSIDSNEKMNTILDDLVTSYISLISKKTFMCS